MISDAVCMFIYLFMMNYFPTNMTNLIYLIDSNINLISQGSKNRNLTGPGSNSDNSVKSAGPWIPMISLIMIQKSWRIVIFPWKREKLNYRMSDRSFCQYDGSLGVIRGDMNRSSGVIRLGYG